MTISNTLPSVILTVLPMPIITINSVGMPTTRGCSASTRSAGEVKDDALRRQLFELFSIEPMLDKKIILSSGELRKFQFTKALLTVPRFLSWTILS